MKPIDCVLATAPPYSSFIVAERIARRTKAKMIVDYRDPWAVDRELWRSPYRWQQALESRIERRILARAALVLFTSTPALEYYCEHFALGNRARLLLNGIDRYVPAQRPLPRQPLTWTHAGGVHGGRRSLAPVIRAIAALRREIDPRLVLVGDEPEADLRLASELGVRDAVDWRGRRPLDETLGLLRSSHRLVAVVSNAHPFSIPAKIYDYLSTRRPTLLISDPRHAAARLLEEVPGNAVLDPGDAQGFEDLMRADAAALREGGPADLPPEVGRPFEAEDQVRSLAGWLDEIDAPSPGARE